MSDHNDDPLTGSAWESVDLTAEQHAEHDLAIFHGGVAKGAAIATDALKTAVTHSIKFLSREDQMKIMGGVTLFMIERITEEEKDGQGPRPN